MHKDDQMTPKERAFALFAGKPVDRMPIKLFSPYIGMNFGASYQDAFVEAKSRAHWLIESYKRFGQDGLSVNYRIDGIPVAFGAESTYDPLGIPMIKENILKDFSEIDQLDLEKIRFENDPNAQTAFEAVQIIQDALNDEIFTGVGLMGPFTTAANLAGVENLCEKIKKDFINFWTSLRTLRLKLDVNSWRIRLGSDLLSQQLPFCHQNSSVNLSFLIM